MAACVWVATICVRPNTLGPIDWYTAAWLIGMLGALLTVLASPLTNELAAALGIATITVPVPSMELKFPNFTVATWNMDAPTVHLGGSSMVIPYTWWLPAASLMAASTLAFASHYALSLGLLGLCSASPALWRHTQMIDDDEAMAELRDWIGHQCATQRDKYAFGLALRDAWIVHNADRNGPCSNPGSKHPAYPPLQIKVLSLILASAVDAQYTTLQVDFAERGKPSSVARFFHGTRRDSASAITCDGFRLPGWHGMFGRGVYFADCPLKSLQYAGWGWGDKVNARAESIQPAHVSHVRPTGSHPQLWTRARGAHSTCLCATSRRGVRWCRRRRARSSIQRAACRLQTAAGLCCRSWSLSHLLIRCRCPHQRAACACRST